jgi:hypothetical protein
MQTTGSFHDQVIKILTHIAKNLMHDAKDFDPADAVFNPDTLF